MVPAHATALRLAVATLAFVAATVVAPVSSASTPHHAGIVIRDAKGTTHRMCVIFDKNTITGIDLLRHSGYSVDIAQSSLGAAVCRIGGGGCSSGNCFCHYPTFWGYWTLDPRAKSWRFSQTGAQDRVVRDGSLDAWVWGRNGRPPPRPLAFREVCPLAAGRTASKPKTQTRGNYLAFAGFVAAFVVAGFALARRRAKRHP